MRTTAPTDSELFIRSLFVQPAQPGQRVRTAETGPVVAVSEVASQPEGAPILEKSIGQGATLRTCKDIGKMRAEGDSPEGEAHREAMRYAIDAIIQGAGFKLEGESIMRSYGDQKPEYGYTYMATIGQSCISIHTYPERGSVSVRVDVCSSEMQKIEREDGKDSIIVLFESLNAFFAGNRFRDPASKEDAKDETLSEILKREESPL